MTFFTDSGPVLTQEIVCRRQGKIYNINNNVDHDDDAENRKTTADLTENLSIRSGADEVIIITNYRVTKELVTQYKTVCGDSIRDDQVPLCFPDCLFVHNFLLLICKSSFKLSPLGLIHVGQTIKQHEDLQQLLDAPCSLEARTKEYRLVHRGVEVDISVKVFSASDQCVWSGVTTLLSRSQHAQSSGSVAATAHRKVIDPVWDSEGRNIHQQLIAAGGNTGVQYARVSGDWNPHHLYPWSSRLLGYRAPIAHGLWTLAKAVSHITATTDLQTGFTEVEGRFKCPLFLPGKAILEHYTDGSTVKFRVIDSGTQAPHLLGTLT